MLLFWLQVSLELVEKQRIHFLKGAGQPKYERVGFKCVASSGTLVVRPPDDLRYSLATYSWYRHPKSQVLHHYYGRPVNSSLFRLVKFCSICTNCFCINFYNFQRAPPRIHIHVPTPGPEPSVSSLTKPSSRVPYRTWTSSGWCDQSRPLRKAPIGFGTVLDGRQL